MPGFIELEGYGVVIDDLNALNRESETQRLGMQYEALHDALNASAHGNVSTYRVLVQELRRHLRRGGVQCKVTLSTGECRTLLITPTLVQEDGSDVTSLFE
jgi:hypothetical protein